MCWASGQRELWAWCTSFGAVQQLESCHRKGVDIAGDFSLSTLECVKNNGLDFVSACLFPAEAVA